MSKTYAQVLSIASKELKKIGLDNSIGDSKKILAHIMGISKEKLLLLNHKLNKVRHLLFISIYRARNLITEPEGG